MYLSLSYIALQSAMFYYITSHYIILYIQFYITLYYILYYAVVLYHIISYSYVCLYKIHIPDSIYVCVYVQVCSYVVCTYQNTVPE